MQRLWTLVPGHLSSHSALSSYGLFAPLAYWRLSVSLRPLVHTLGSCPASGAPWSPAMPPSLGRGRVNNNMICCILQYYVYVVVAASTAADNGESSAHSAWRAPLTERRFKQIVPTNCATSSNRWTSFRRTSHRVLRQS